MPVSSLSIIVPFRGVAGPFEDTLISVLQNRPNDCDVVVVHAGPYGDPYGLREEVHFVPAPAQSSLLEQVTLGIRASNSEIVHLLSCGLEVQDGWTEVALQHFEDEAVAAVAPLIVRHSTGRIVSAGVQSTLTGLRRTVLADQTPTAVSGNVRCDGPDLLGGFWRKLAWERAGGFDATFGDWYADVDLALTLKRLGYTAVVEPSCQLVQTFELAQHESPWWEGRYAERLFWKHAKARGWRGSIVLHAACLACEFVGSLPRPHRMAAFLGRTRAFVERRRAQTSPTMVSTSRSDKALTTDPIRRRDAAGVFPDSDLRSVSKRNAVQPY